jgi:hypothetical protein
MSYSEAAVENFIVCPCDDLAEPATLRKIVKSVVDKEDRTRNVIVLGSGEVENKNVSEQVHEVFAEIRLKPVLQAYRVSKTSDSKWKR